MDAGPELDAEIARRVFGLTLITATLDATVSWDGGPADCGVWVLYEPLWQQPWGPHVSGTVPRYSQDIGAAWLVVEHLIAQGWEPQVHYSTDPPGPHWEAWLWQFEGTHPHVVTRDEHNYTAATAPEAICRAALAASPSPPAPAVRTAP